MDYLGNYLDLRDNPALLYPGARTVICVALNYYPARVQPRENPQFAYYAYGLDYHEVMREKLRRLAAFVTTLSGDPGCGSVIGPCRPGWALLGRMPS